MKKRGRNGRRIRLEIGQDRRDSERMNEIGVARFARLAAMRLHRKNIGAIEKMLVDMRIVFAHPVNEFVLTDQMTGRRLRRLFCVL
jgi:hypothetical protein